MSSPRWDVFCRVVDNLGDVGVCWRLAADLASRGVTVRLWIDDAAALAWMAPGGSPGVDVRNWPADGVDVEPGNVVIEAFGCALPDPFIARMAARAPPPVWINLEYLSAEADVERSHGLASPQGRGPGRGLVKWFFYPGFTRRTGGLIREPGLLRQRSEFDREAWFGRLGLQRRPHERVASVFCYAQPQLAPLLAALAPEPTLLLLAPGAAVRQATELLDASLQRGAARAVVLPWLAQTDFDRLLWSCDLNFVRGEDSFVRAQWAGVPFVWQAYPQSDEVHHVKVRAFLDRLLVGADASVTEPVRALWEAWNGVGTASPLTLPAWQPWRRISVDWRESLLTQPDLTTQLLEFARQKG